MSTRTTEPDFITAQIPSHVYEIMRTARRTDLEQETIAMIIRDVIDREEYKVGFKVGYDTKGQEIRSKEAAEAATSTARFPESNHLKTN